MHHKLTEKDWAETFKPLNNPFDANAAWCGWSITSSDQEATEYINRTLSENPNRIWSITQADGRLQIVPGYCKRSDAEGYIVTEVSFSNEDTYAICDCEVVDFEEGEPVGIIELDGEEFAQRYRPLVNHIKTSVDWFGWRYEPRGKELKYIRKIAESEPLRVWAIDEDEGAVITSDWSFDFMPAGFIVTEIPGSRHIEWLRAYFDEDEVLGDKDEDEYSDE